MMTLHTNDGEKEQEYCAGLGTCDFSTGQVPCCGFVDGWVAARLVGKPSLAASDARHPLSFPSPSSCCFVPSLPPLPVSRRSSPASRNTLDNRPLQPSCIPGVRRDLWPGW